jgi:hypothetical protein
LTSQISNLSATPDKGSPGIVKNFYLKTGIALHPERATVKPVMDVGSKSAFFKVYSDFERPF